MQVLESLQISRLYYEYDAVGNATKVVHHNGETVRYSYDVFGRLSEIMYPDGYCTNYEYDLCDRLVKVTGRDSGVTTYEYDANGNVLLCDRSNGTYTTYTYNARNEQILLENRRDSGDLLSSYAYEYDRNGFITKETEKVDSYTYVREYTYDAVGQLVSYTETTNGKTTATYSYTYDKAGNRVGMVYYDASNTKYWTNYVYNENNELISETYNYDKNKKKVISTETTYTYDTDGNLITKDADGDIWQYLWTSESRLEAVVNGGTLLMAATYDGDNNRIFQISDASSSSKVHQDSSLKSEWKSENGNSYPWENGNGNGGNGTGHSNTGNGGTTNGGGHNHTGNNSDGLKHASCKQCVDTQEAFVQSLADDAVSIDGTDYLPVGKPNSYKDYELIYYINDVTIDNEEVLVEYGAAGTATGTYEYGLQRLSVEHVNEAKEYYLYNGTGNVVQTTAENGSAFLRYTYDPFGNVTSINAPMTVDIDDLNRYTYNGEDYDYNTGLQYLRARYYSTGTGNFISQDTYLGQTFIPLTQNRYTYTGNNPVMYDDPSGHYYTNPRSPEYRSGIYEVEPQSNNPRSPYYVNEKEDTYIDTVILEVSKNTLRDICENWDYLSSMNSSYGFDIESSFLILQAYDLLIENHNSDATFFAYMASLCDNYNGGKGIRWKITGNVPDQKYTTKVVLDLYGMSYEQISFLYEAINTQHKDENMGTKDFAHEMVALSIMTNPTVKDEIMDFVTQDDINLLGSIKGDLYSGSGVDPYGRDITSDIDAYNVYMQLQTGDNALDVLVNYNQEMVANPHNRYSEYVEHFGGKENFETLLSTQSAGTDYLWGTHWVQKACNFITGKENPDQNDIAKKEKQLQINIDNIMNLFEE